MVENIICGSCKNELTNSMEVEHSFLLGEYFCNPGCATNRYFDYTQSSTIDFSIKDPLFKLINGKLVRR